MPHTLLVTCRSVLFNVKTKYFYYFIYFIFIIFILFLYYFRCFFIVLVYCQGCGGFWVGSVGFWVVPARFRVVPADSGGFCVLHTPRENVPYDIRSNGWTHGKWTDKKRLDKPFEMDRLNGCKFFSNGLVERLNGCNFVFEWSNRTAERM